MANSYSTSRVARPARLRYWNDLHGNLAVPLEIKSRNRHEFDAAASVAEVGPLRFVKVDSAPAVVEHAARHVAQTRERRYRVLLTVHGNVNVRHAGREARLEEGDFALLDDSVPYRIDFADPNQSLCVAIPPATLKEYVPVPARLCGLCMKVERPLNKIASTMLSGIWSQIESEKLQLEHRPTLARSFLQVLAAAYAVDHACPIERSVMAAARRTEIKRYIESHLRSPDLTPTSIAKALGLSRRYLRLLFAAEHDSLTAYLKRRRLEECAFELAQPEWRGRSITATASDWGFRSVTHFARAFKAAYGETPSAFKHAHVRSEQPGSQGEARRSS